MTTGGDRLVYKDAKPPVGTTPTVVEENLNVELLKNVLEYVKENPQTWNQKEWVVLTDSFTGKSVPHLINMTYEEINSCGSSYCFAGHAALMEGFPAPDKFSMSGWNREIEGSWYEESVSDFATKRLGIDYSQADVLFHPSNTMEDLEKLVNSLIEDPKIDYESMEKLTSWHSDDYDDDEFDDDDF